MENYREKLKYLISLKKTKKEPNKLEREEFLNNWTQLVDHEGFSSEAEEFLYCGFIYSGAKPLKNFMKKQEHQTDVLNQLYRGKWFRDNCASTVPLLFHLLALSMNESQRQMGVLASIIEHIPAAMKNKEGKIYGRADQAIKKYFLDELKSDISFPEVTELISDGLTAAMAVRFANQLVGIIETMDASKYSNRCKDNIRKIKEWIHPECETEDKTQAEAENREKFEAQVETENCEEPGGAEDAEKKEPEKVEKRITALKTTIETLNNKLEMADREKAVLSGKNDALQRSIADAAASNKEKSKKISLYQQKIKELENDVIILKEKCDIQEQEISRRTELIEMLRRDRSRQGDEAQNRIASRLRSYYADYVDAESMEMSIDLGENMRDQLGEVFKILISAGMNLG